MKPGVFSISFGSLLSLRLAGHKDYMDRHQAWPFLGLR